MPVLTIYGLPNKVNQNMIESFCEQLQYSIVEIKELNLTKDQITVFFPPDKMVFGLGEEIIIFVDGLFEKPERTPEVKNLLAKKIGEFTRRFFFMGDREEYPKVECFIRSFDPRQGFYSSEA